MDGQKFCLKWNNFQRSVTSVFESLRQDEELVDITLCCEGRKVKAHRMMLSACSPYFRDLLKENPCQHPVFFLKDTSFAELAAVIEFVYKGEVNVAQSQLAGFLKTAEMLQVRGLTGDEEEEAAGSAAAQPQPQPQPQPQAQPQATPTQRQRVQPAAVPAAAPAFQRTPMRPAASPAAPTSFSGLNSRVRPVQSPLEQPHPASPPVKRRRTSGGEGDQKPPDLPASSGQSELSAADQPPPPPPPQRQQSDCGIKVEKIDIADDEDDESLEATLGQVSSFEAGQYEGGSDQSASSHDMAGLLAGTGEPGMMGDLGAQAEDGSSQGLTGAARSGRKGKSIYRICDLCQKPLYSESAYWCHMDVHRGRTKCFICGRVLSSKHSLESHMNSVHGSTTLQQPQE